MTYFICKNCGFGSASWYGKCPDCNQWNTLTERPDFAKNTSGKKELVKKMTFSSLSKIKPLSKDRKKTGIFEFDRVLGGGFVTGEAVLLTGEPGVGKSTLLLQALENLKTIYISGEEAADQIKDRAERLQVKLDNFYFSNDVQIEGIMEGLLEMKNKIDIVVIDSIQTMYSKNIDTPPGNISQLRESTIQLTSFAKKNNFTIIIVGHINKEGEIAGPKTLEHVVDCVINFEGEKVSNFRLLRASKNRFGPTDEIGIFEMKGQGLVEVKNPLVFLDDTNKPEIGKAIVGVSEGKRTLFFEIQTLAVFSNLSMPRRVVKGLDYNKVLLLLAVIRKYLNIPLDRYDIYVNIIGGVNIKSTAADLGLIASLISSVKNIPIAKNNIFIGEVGLLGEIRKIYSEDKIVSEAKRLGFKKIFSSSVIQNIIDLKKLF